MDIIVIDLPKKKYPLKTYICAGLFLSYYIVICCPVLMALYLMQPKCLGKLVDYLAAPLEKLSTYGKL